VGSKTGDHRVKLGRIEMSNVSPGAGGGGGTTGGDGHRVLPFNACHAAYPRDAERPPQMLPAVTKWFPGAMLEK
jgi:hypothetical protein